MAPDALPDLTHLVPYRSMERFEEPTVADEMRLESDRAKAEALKAKVEACIKSIRWQAKQGEYTHLLNHDNVGRMDRETALLIAASLDHFGFDCEVLPGEYWRKWYSRPDPTDFIWQIQVTW